MDAKTMIVNKVITKTEQVYLSDALDFSSFDKTKLNLITAPCGSGKTVAAFKTIPQYLNIEPQHCLILINVNAAADDFVAHDYAEYLITKEGREWFSDFDFTTIQKPIVMTYAAFGAQIKRNPNFCESYDYIVCDEIHCLNQYIGMSRTQLYKRYPQANPWEINDFLRATCLTYIALETIITTISKGNKWFFALTATPSQLYKGYLSDLGAIVNEVIFSSKLHAYETFSTFEYDDIEPILRMLVPENRKRLFYFTTIKELIKAKQILLECGRKAEALWSLNASESLSKEAKTTRDYILREHKLPEDVQDLLINGAYETGISIKDNNVQEVYIHTSNPDTRIQARNRLRQNIQVVGYYNKNLKKSRARYKTHITTPTITIPNNYLNKNLTVDDKNKLIEEINCDKKWPTLKRLLIEQGRYDVKDVKNNTKKYSIITEK